MHWQRHVIHEGAGSGRLQVGHLWNNDGRFSKKRKLHVQILLADDWMGFFVPTDYSNDITSLALHLQLAAQPYVTQHVFARNHAQHEIAHGHRQLGHLAVIHQL